MEQEKNNKGIIVLLVVIIVILLSLVILLATGTVNFKSNETNNNASDNQVTDTTNSTQNLQNWIGEYKGTDPWNENVTITLTSISENKLDWTFANSYCKNEVSSELINNTASYHIQGTCDDNKHEIDYSVVLTLKDNNVMFKYVSGYMMSIAPTGNASFNNVGPLTENEKTVVLKKAA